MPKLSLWKNGAHSADYKFIDRRISEQFTIGGTGIYVHKYLGTYDQNLLKTTSSAQTASGVTLTFSDTSDIKVGSYAVGLGIPPNTRVTHKNGTTVTLSASTTSPFIAGGTVKFYDNPTNPSYLNESAQNIQDLLFLENRDRKYDTSVYSLRGIYQVQDVTFDLSQFGMFLQTGTLFIVFHINDMVETMGRKLMSGDVIELQHLKDYYPLDNSLPVALKRYYVVGDCQNAAEGYSATWWPHLWRCKINPLTDSQEFKSLLDQIKVDENIPGTGGNVSLGSVSSIISQYQAINDAILAEAEVNVQYSGYDTRHLYVKPVTVDGLPGEVGAATADNVDITADDNSVVASSSTLSPDKTIPGWLVGDGEAPNGLPVTSGIAFPPNPSVGDYALRTDYLPNRMFRWDGRRWIKIEDNVRTNLTPGFDNNTQLGDFINNNNTFTNNSGVVQERQSLSKAILPKADN